MTARTKSVRPIQLLSRRVVLVYLWGGLALLASSLVGCGSAEPGGPAGINAPLAGSVTIDGSSTVYPLTEAVAEQFREEHPKVRISAGESGTGGGFQKFAANEIDICDASRPIKESERKKCAEAGIEYVELSVAFDGLSVVVHAKNDWVTSLTVEQLRELWRPDSGVKTWRDLDPAWPDHKITLYGPGTDSGTFEYFTEVIVGKSGASRADYFASEDDNQLVSGIASDPYALGYFGFAYYNQNQDRLKVLSIDSGEGPIAPSQSTIRSGQYKPLSRPLLIYLKGGALARPEVREFSEFYLETSGLLATEVGYVPLSDEELARQKEHLHSELTRLTGGSGQAAAKAPEPETKP